jgi:NADH:ubiquinone oxidoreductase subunit 3 (subunit A)
MTCFYLSCNLEVFIIFVLLMATIGICMMVIDSFLRKRRLAKCTAGEHEQYYIRSYGISGYSTWCECGEEKFMCSRDY